MGLKNRECLEFDLPLAQGCFLEVSSNPKYAHLIAPMRDWLQDIREQLAVLDAEDRVQEQQSEQV